MSVQLEPCADCTGPAAGVNWGVLALCETCLERRRAPIRERVIARQGDVDRWPPPSLDGRGIAVGPIEQTAELSCDQCGHGWYGPPGEPCGWCRHALDELVRSQRTMLLWPELPAADPGYRHTQERRRHAVDLWAERLAGAVIAGTITEGEARDAYDREVSCDAAAAA